MSHLLYHTQYYDLNGIEILMPWWMGDPRLHDSHKSNLLRKYPEYYRQFGWDVPEDLPYFWPVVAKQSSEMHN